MQVERPIPEILYQSETLRVVSNGYRSAVCYLTFGHLLYRKQGPNFWGDGFFAKHALAAIGFVPTEPDWFPEQEMRRAAEAIRPALSRAKEERLVTYGVSMGGYAALKYAALLSADAAIAFSPQISINPGDIGRFDPRYVRFYDRARNGDMRIRAVDLAPENHVIYDNFWTVDRKHADLIATLGPVQRFALPFTGHASIRAIAEGHIAEPFLQRVIGEPTGKAGELRGMIRGTRKNTLVYWESRAVTLAGRRPAATRQILHAVQNALTLAPNVPAWQIAEVAALLNAGERDEAEWKLGEIPIGGQLAIGQWVRYIDCWRRIHGDQATIEMMGRAPAEVQGHAAFRFEDAVIRFDMGDVASAAAILALLWPEQDAITRRMKLGQMLNATGEKEKALGVFRQLTEQAPTAENLVALAAALAEDRANTEHRSEALVRLAEARKIIDPEATLWRRVLLLHDGLDDRQAHVEAAREAIKALPGYPDLRMELAIALERAGQHGEALEQGLRLAGQHARIRRLDWLILMLRKAGMRTEALALARTATVERPDDSASRLQLAVLLLEKNEEEEAFQHLVALRGQPIGRLDLMEDAVEALAAVGLYTDAAKAAARLASGRPDQLSAQLLLVDRLIVAGLPKDAIILLRQARRLVGNDPEGLCKIAGRYRRAGEAPRAEELFARALNLASAGDRPWQIAARMELIALESQHGGRSGLAAARRAAGELEGRGSTEPGFWAGLADLFSTLGEASRALKAIGRAVALAPDDPEPRLREAELLIAAGNPREARKRLVTFDAPRLSRAHFARAIVALAGTGDAAAAGRMAESRLQQAPQDAVAKLALARARGESGDEAGARALLLELIERRAGDARFWSGIGDLFLDLKDWPRAKLAAERAVANDPGNAKRAEQIIGIVRLLGSRGPPVEQAATGRIVSRAARSPSLFSLLASTFRRS